MTYKGTSTRPVSSRALAELLRQGQGKLRLRTKLLYSFVFLKADHQRHSSRRAPHAQEQVERQIELDTRNATRTFQAVERQQQTALSRKAEVCSHDLEGIVAKRKLGTYKDSARNWLKIKNPNYTQSKGRHELLTHSKK